MRKTKQELNELCAKLKINTLYSWSRVNKYRTSPYEYFLSYVANPRPKPDREDSIYGSSGGFCHDILERYYKKEIEYNDMINEFEDAITTLEVADLKFDRSNEEKNNNIKQKYFENLRHFFNNHISIKTKVDLERFVTIKVGKYYLQGYIDLTKRDADGNFVIQDWKTSSIYKGDKAIKEAGQLILYSEALRQLGVPLEKIKICWDFLKYASVTTQQANGKENIRQIERCKIGESLKTNAKMWLKKCGYEDELDYYLNLLTETNNIECLPKEVKEKYEIKDCYVFVDLTEDLLKDFLSELEKTIDDMVAKEEEYKTKKDEKLFWDDEESVEKQSYYFANLCSYSANLHKPYAEYLNKLKTKEEVKNNIFGGVGDGLVDETDEDLAWLNNL